MTKDELLADIAKGRSVAERLPLYAAAMQLGLIPAQDIQSVVKAEKVATPRKTAAKKAATKTTQTA